MTALDAPVAAEDVPNAAGGRRPTGGRDLPTAVGVALVLVALVLASLLIVKAAFVVLASVAIVLALWELTQAFARADIHLPYVPLAIGAVGMCVSAYASGLEALMVATVLTLITALGWRIIEGGGPMALRDIAGAAFATVYLPLMAGFVVLMLAMDQGQWYVLTFIALAVASDTGGFFAGVAFGKHPLAPSVSPKKTWEGLAGSLLLTWVVAAVATWALDLDPISGAVLGLLTPLSATLGDLVESALKRDLDLKDMGRLLPGHGGILDRIDSMLLTAPFVFVVLTTAAGTLTS